MKQGNPVYLFTMAVSFLFAALSTDLPTLHDALNWTVFWTFLAVVCIILYLKSPR